MTKPHEDLALGLSFIEQAAYARVRSRPGCRIQSDAHGTLEVSYCCGEATFKFAFRMVAFRRFAASAHLTATLLKYRFALDSQGQGSLDELDLVWDQLERKCAEGFYSDPKLLMLRRLSPTYFKRAACLRRGALSTSRRYADDEPEESIELVDDQVSLF